MKRQRDKTGAVIGCECCLCCWLREQAALDAEAQRRRDYALAQTVKPDASQGDCEAARATWGLRKNMENMTKGDKCVTP